MKKLPRSPNLRCSRSPWSVSFTLSTNCAYWQHFCGEIYFQYNLPFDPSDFVHFRHRNGKEGMEKIFKQSIDLFGTNFIRKEVKEVRGDTTVQEKKFYFSFFGGYIRKSFSP